MVLFVKTFFRKSWIEMMQSFVYTECLQKSVSSYHLDCFVLIDKIYFKSSSILTRVYSL